MRLSLVNWALSIPAFQSLRNSDQQMLLDETLTELILLTILQYRGSFSYETMSLLVQQNCFNLLDTWRLKDLIDYIDTLNLDHVEFTCLKALILFKPGEVIRRGELRESLSSQLSKRGRLFLAELRGLGDVSQISMIQDQAQMLLYQHTMNICPGLAESSPLRFGRLLLLLSAIKRMNRHHFGSIQSSLFNFPV